MTTSGECGSAGRLVLASKKPRFDPRHLIKPGTVVHSPDASTQETQAVGSVVLGHLRYMRDPPPFLV